MTDDRGRFGELLPGYWDGDLTPAEFADFAGVVRGSADPRGRLLDFGIDAHAVAVRLGREGPTPRLRRRWVRVTAARPDGVFEVGYRLAERGEVAVAVQGHGPDGRPTEARHVLPADAALPGTWTTARVPLPEFDGGPGLVVIDSVAVGTGLTDTGLMVDRLAVSRPPAGGPK